jgi:hypothetical protein
MAKDFTIENELSNLSKAVANLPKENPFSLPSTYFDTFPQKLIQRIENKELIPSEPALSEQLADLKNKNPFEVPELYFQQLSFKTPKEEAPVHSLSFKRWASYAAAAACTIGLVLAIAVNSNQQKASGTTASNTFSKDVMESYLAETEVFSINDKESEFLALEENSLTNLSSSSIAEMLKDIPDKDISRYMDLNDFEGMAKKN